MSIAKLCVTVTAGNMAELRRRRDLVTGADLVELRLDSVHDPSIPGALAGRTRPVIVTCRPTWEGGTFAGSEEERRHLLSEALTLGAEYVDVEWNAGFDELVAHRRGKGIVLSTHDFEGAPVDLEQRARAMRATGAEVVKIAIMAHRLTDNLRLAALAAPGESSALVAMGEAGLASRVWATRLGSCWTYAGDGVAPGQVSAARLREEFGFARLGPSTGLYGLVGNPVAHSVSPAMHNAAFDAAGVDGAYLPLAAADLDDFFSFATEMGIRGASVTAPFKVGVFQRADESDAVSRDIGAANTLLADRGRWLARNTDVEAFVAPLQRLLALDGVRATVMGAGGAARAASIALNGAGAILTVCARDRRKAQEVAQTSGGDAAGWPPRPGSWDVLVNATPLGTFPRSGESPLPSGPFTGRLVYDLVYNPPQTRLLRDAAAAGCRTLGGLDMLVAQAQSQFEWWTGLRPAEDVMRRAALKRLSAVDETVRIEHEP